MLPAQTIPVPVVSNQPATAINRILGGPSCTGGCVVVVPGNYPANAEPSGLPLFLHNPFLPNQRIIDYRGGEMHTAADPTGAGGVPATVLGAECLLHAPGTESFCGLFRQRVTAPGFSAGYPYGGNTAPPHGWFTTHGLDLFVDTAAAGLTGGLDISLFKNGRGDAHGMYHVIYGRGGFRTYADEQLQGLLLHAGEASGSYTGTVTSTSGYTLTTTALTGANTQGVGRFLVDLSAPVTSGCVTAQSVTSLSGATQQATVYTLGCGAAPLPVAKCYGTLATSALAVPLIQPSGNNLLTTATPVTLNLAGGSGCTAGDLVDVFGDFSETARVLAATPPANGQQGLTLALSHTVSAGALVFQSAAGLMGLDILANHGDHDQRYVLDTMGVIAPNQIVASLASGGGHQVVPRGNLRLDSFASFPGFLLTNTGGTVSFPIDASAFQNARFIDGYPIVTIAGATNPAFNGPCLNFHQVPNAFPALGQCTQTASSGQTSASASFTIGGTGYGNGNFVLYPMAEVLDVQRYNTLPPAMDGTFRLQPFSPAGFNVGDTVEEPNDVSAGYKASEIALDQHNVFAAQFSFPGQLAYGGAGITGDMAGMRLLNTNPYTQYAGFGGVQLPPRGYVVSGPHLGFGAMDQAPWPAGSPFLSAGLPPAPFDTSTLFHYSVFRGLAPAGVGGLDLDYFPALGTLYLHNPHTALPDAPIVGSPAALAGAYLYACGNPATKELVWKATPCDAP